MQVVARSEFNLIETYGNGLPVSVTELLTFTERNSSVSVNYSKNGWAWAVSGRKLLVWQYKSNTKSPTNSGDIKNIRSRTIASQCRELTLPHCDIGHKARLIRVFVPEGSQTTACLAISATGDVRYWPSITNAASIDENGILEGQEFDQLISINTQGYLLVTTTCSLIYLQLIVQNGRQKIVHRTVKPPTGFFGGFGRKVASIIIGNSNQESENKLIKITHEIMNSNNYYINVLSEHSLQRWIFHSSGQETYLFEDHEISKKIRDMYKSKMWSNRPVNEPIAIWTLDMQTIDRGVLLLCAGANLSFSPQVYITLVSVIAEDDGYHIKDVQLIRYKTFHSNQLRNIFTDFKFILCRGMAYIYCDRVIIPIVVQENSPMLPPIDEIEKIEIHTQDDRLISAKNVGNMPLFFSLLNGIVCVTPSDFADEFINASVNISMSQSMVVDYAPAPISQHENSSILAPGTTNVGNLTMFDLDPEEIRERNKDAVSQFKASFIYHLKRNNGMCQTIINEMFNEETRHVDSRLDKIVLEIAKDLAEDLPAADPRWESELMSRNATISLGSSNSMQILQQLREKSFCLVKFVEFLHATGLWNKLMAINVKGNTKCTSYLLADINEKIVASIALKCQHQSHARIIDEAIELVLSESEMTVSGNLTNQDIFYTQITKIEKFFKKLSDIIENFIQQEVPNHQLQNAIVEVNTIVLQVLQEVIKFREKNMGLYRPVGVEMFEYLPWTASSEGLREILLNLIQTTLRHGIRLNGENEFKFKHYQQMTELIDFVMDGKRNYIASIRNNEEKFKVLQHQYESQRFDLIYPLVEDEQFELAAKLAEKYLDFQTLVIVCDRTENQKRLDEYIERFKDLNFSQFAIGWHMKQKKQGDLFERFRNNQVELANFLNNHPSLAWVQLFFNGEMSKASNVLLELAENEEELAARKKVSSKFRIHN
jgi:nuclear pore complex protein Nup133